MKASVAVPLILLAFLQTAGTDHLSVADPGETHSDRGSTAAPSDLDPSTPGALRVARADGTLVEMPLQHTSVAIEVSAFVERATIEQTFVNPFDHPIEAVYTFPLGDRAAVDDFELVVGERIVRGEIKRREEAREVYETARAEGYQAALLEQERPNIFTQSIANIEPGKPIKVRIRTVETLVYDKGVYRLTFPLVVGPRYIPGGAAPVGGQATEPVESTRRVPDAPRITPPVLAPGFRSGHDVEISVSLDAGVPLTSLASPSHKLRVERPSPSKARVRLATEDTIPNKDFLLRWSVASEKPAVGLLAHRRGLDGFFTLLVQPKGEVSADAAAPKEIILVVDTSGSMSGIPIDASKRFVRKALRELGPRDTFNLIRFAGTNEVYSRTALPNTEAQVERGIAWMDRVEGSGGTEMLAALKAALAQPADPDRIRMVVFLTDGYVGDDDEILGHVARAAASATRIYTVGIGGSVNHYLLDRMADLGGGAYVFIRPDEKADDAIDSFRAWVTKPYLTDLSIDWGSLDVADIAPERVRDLSSGQTLALVGRYLNSGRGEVVLRGRVGGRYWENRLEVVLPDSEPRNEALASLWARGRIESLLLQSPGAVPDSARAEVTSLALAYRLMSPYTSFVAVDDTRLVNPGGRAPVVHQALPMPDGVSFEGVFGKQGPVAFQTASAGAGAGATEDQDEVRAVPALEATSQATRMSQMAMMPPPPPSPQNLAAALPNPPPPLPAKSSSPGPAEGSSAGTAGGVVGGVPRETVKVKAKVVDVGNTDSDGRTSAGTVGGVLGGVPGGVAGPGASTSFSDNFVADLPVLGRSAQNVLALAPGVNDPSKSGNPNTHGSRTRDFKAIVGGVSGVDPLTGQLLSNINPDAIEVVTPGSGSEYGGAVGGFGKIVTKQGSGKKGLHAPNGALPSLAGTRGVSSSAARLFDMALRVLADLADDGRLTASEGQPALVGLLAAQRPNGAVAEDVTVHAIATWALAEAAAKMSHDPWVKEAANKAADYLDGLATSTGWPSQPGGGVAAETTRWARLALRVARPGEASVVPLPKGTPSEAYTRLRSAIVDARTGARPPSRVGKSPFHRLVAVIGRGHLAVSRVSNET